MLWISALDMLRVVRVFLYHVVLCVVKVGVHSFGVERVRVSVHVSECVCACEYLCLYVCEHPCVYMCVCVRLCPCLLLNGYEFTSQRQEEGENMKILLANKSTEDLLLYLYNQYKYYLRREVEAETGKMKLITSLI